jgi:hypothetical protein
VAVHDTGQGIILRPLDRGMRELTEIEDDPLLLPDDPQGKWMFERIGEFMCFFSQLEFVLRQALSFGLGLPKELFEPVTASYDFRALCDVTLAVCRVRWPEPATVAEFEKLIKRCKRINDDVRVRIAHGTWDTHEVDGDWRWSARHMSRQSLIVRPYFENPRDIAQAVKECHRLFVDVDHLVFSLKW